MGEALTRKKQCDLVLTMSSEAAAVIFCILLAGLAIFQLALALGAPLGRFAWGGAHERLPKNLRIGSIIAIAIYAAFAVIALDCAGLLDILPSAAIANVGIWVIVAYLALGAVMNAISRAKPERFVMTPLALVLCALATVIAFNPQASAQTASVMSAAAKDVVARWQAEFQKGLDFAAAHPPTTMAEELNQRVGIEQTGRTALDAVNVEGLPADQMQLALSAIWTELSARDADNTAWLKTKLPADGWFRASRDGADVASNAWLIVQHSPDKDWQREVLARMTPLVATGEVNGPDYALLYDRVEVFLGHPQRYGSQGVCTNGEIVLAPLEDEARVDDLRATVGLGSLADYKLLLRVGRKC